MIQVRDQSALGTLNCLFSDIAWFYWFNLMTRFSTILHNVPWIKGSELQAPLELEKVHSQQHTKGTPALIPPFQAGNYHALFMTILVPRGWTTCCHLSSPRWAHSSWNGALLHWSHSSWRQPWKLRAAMGKIVLGSSSLRKLERAIKPARAARSCAIQSLKCVPSVSFLLPQEFISFSWRVYLKAGPVKMFWDVLTD